MSSRGKEGKKGDSKNTLSFQKICYKRSKEIRKNLEDDEGSKGGLSGVFFQVSVVTTSCYAHGRSHRNAGNHGGQKCDMYKRKIWVRQKKMGSNAQVEGLALEQSMHS